MVVSGVTMADLRKNPPTALADLWGAGWIVDPSLVLIAADPKAGKSLFGMQLLGALADPKTTTFLGEPVGTVRKVLYLNEEIPQSGVLNRARLIWGEDGQEWDEKFVIPPERGVRLDLDAGELVNIVQTLKPNVVMLDPIARYHNWDENSNQAMGELLRRIQLVVHLGVTVILIHHFHKPSLDGRQATGRARGASRFLSDPDSIFALETNDSGKTIEVTALLRHGEWPGPMKLIRDGNLRFTRVE